MTQIYKNKLYSVRDYRTVRLVLAFVVVFGAIGSYVIFQSNAATPGSAITSGYAGKCMDDYRNGASIGTKVDIYTCNGSAAQKWQVNTSGNIKINSLCVGLDGNGTVQGTKVILVTCSNSTLLQWLLQSDGKLVNLGASRKCLTASSSTNSTQLDVQSCLSGAHTSQSWSGGPIPTPTPPPPDTQAPSVPRSLKATRVTTHQITLAWIASTDNVGVKGYHVYRNNTLIGSPTGTSILVANLANGTTYPFAVHAYDAAGNVSGAATVSVRTLSPPKPKPTPNPSPAPTQQVVITPKPTPTPILSLPKKSTTPAPTLNVGTPTMPATNPTASDVSATVITASSITLTWQSSDATDYTIRYGLSPNQLYTVRSLHSTDANVSFKLTGLPPGKKIYISITPSANGQPGSAIQVSFHTDASRNVLPVVVAALLATLASMAILAVRRRKRNLQPIIDTGAPSTPVFPREDSESYASRLLWWLPENERQQTIHHPPAAKRGEAFDDIPDMFEEGRKRLDAERHGNQHKEE